jgi:hypothetical protein
MAQRVLVVEEFFSLDIFSFRHEISEGTNLDYMTTKCGQRVFRLALPS